MDASTTRPSKRWPSASRRSPTTRDIRRELRRLTAERSEFLTRDGRTFFWLMEVQDGERDPEQIIQPVLIAWGEDGTVVAEFTIRQESFASYG